MKTMQTPNYVKTLLEPATRKTASRKVWSIDLEGVWLPFFTAANVQGQTAISRDVLGAPLRLAKAKDGTVKFSATGRPIIRVVSELSDQIRIVRENFTASLVTYASTVAKDNPDAYKSEVEACQHAGQPIIAQANLDIEMAIARANEQIRMAQAIEKAASDAVEKDDKTIPDKAMAEAVA
ncbi:MAG: hypothetical protein PHV74_07025 [Dehalococcoidia bacterium]|nr:hypothetical protein [Dehalococcoidia bacterium]